MLMKHWPNGITEVSEVLAHNQFNIFFLLTPSKLMTYAFTFVILIILNALKPQQYLLVRRRLEAVFGANACGLNRLLSFIVRGRNRQTEFLTNANAIIDQSSFLNETQLSKPMLLSRNVMQCRPSFLSLNKNQLRMTSKIIALYHIMKNSFNHYFKQFLAVNVGRLKKNKHRSLFQALT